jgi:hypothetical protein
MISLLRARRGKVHHDDHDANEGELRKGIMRLLSFERGPATAVSSASLALLVSPIKIPASSLQVVSAIDTG